ncbi:MAG: hypothetical protein H6707_16765 [Deltaproteobacteria bacterium]|nr:hypothetical protein [Deltaproteobacteria bacterium]
MVRGRGFEAHVGQTVRARTTRRSGLVASGLVHQAQVDAAGRFLFCFDADASTDYPGVVLYIDVDGDGVCSQSVDTELAARWFAWIAGRVEDVEVTPPETPKTPLVCSHF